MHCAGLLVVFIKMAEQKKKRSRPVHKLTARKKPGSSLMIYLRMEEYALVSTVSTVLTMFVWIL